MCNDQLACVHGRLPHRIACAMINLCETSKVALYKWIKDYQLVFLMIKLYFWPQSHFICELSVASYQLRVGFILQVASCKLRVAS